MNETLYSRSLRSWLFLALSCLPVLAGAVDSRTPEQVIQETVNLVAGRVEAERAQLASDPAALFALVDEAFLPVFDTDYAGRLILGRHWRAASDEQRRKFVATCYDFIVRSYARNVLNFRKDQVSVLPAPPGQTDDPRRTIVRTQMRLDDGSTLAVDYSLRRTSEGWRVFDVRIEGISYVQNYRNQFDAEISARGLDAVIARLQDEARNAGSGEASQEPAASGTNP